ncbi:DUF2274 domain-containing protein [Roseospira marina]|uniref:DUF2274 domain-containing protein n=1 Tax=Roseospira marina TaxID=140057 RepID=UPI0035D40E4F
MQPSAPPGNETGPKSQHNAALYEATYGETESVADLIPFMVRAFLDGDRAFNRARKDGLGEGDDPAAPRRRQRKPAGAGSTDGPEPTSQETKS